MSSLGDTIDRLTPGPVAVVLFSAILGIWLLYVIETRQRETNRLLRRQASSRRRMKRRMREARKEQEQEEDQTEEMLSDTSSNDAGPDIDTDDLDPAHAEGDGEGN